MNTIPIELHKWKTGPRPIDITNVKKNVAENLLYQIMREDHEYTDRDIERLLACDQSEQETKTWSERLKTEEEAVIIECGGVYIKDIQKGNESKSPKDMYALTYIYEACDDNRPYAVTIAVSEDKERLAEEMEKCVLKDTRVDEDDEWNEDMNYRVVSRCGNEVHLQHRQRINLDTRYEINLTKLI